MAKVFEITTTTENLIADVAETAKASVIFTVTNVSGKPLRGMASLHPLERTEEAWLSLEGEAEKDFATSGTQQFTVIFNKPLQPVAEGQTEPEEKYPYRLNIASAIRPDEDYAEGPLITIYKPERKGVTKKGGIPWWVFLIIGVVFLAIICVVLFLVLRGGGTTDGDGTPTPTPTATPTVTPTLPPPPSPITQVGVPGVEGLAVSDAITRLQKAGLVVKRVDVTNPDGAPNRVTEQNPKQGVLVVPGSPVEINVVAATTVPALAGKNFSQLKAALSSASLVLGTRTIPRIKMPLIGNPIPQNEENAIVSTQSLAPTLIVAKGRKVNIVYRCPSGFTCSGADVKN